MILHILNGDYALNGWNQCRFQGTALVWRENYLHGTIPSTDDMTLFNQIRAEELHKIAQEKSVDEIFADLQMMHKKLFSLRSDDKIVLWLDFCPFDQAMKKQLLKHISALSEKPELYLVQQDVVWNRENFEQYSDWENHPYTFTV